MFKNILNNQVFQYSNKVDNTYYDVKLLLPLVASRKNGRRIEQAIFKPGDIFNEVYLNKRLEYVFNDYQVDMQAISCVGAKEAGSNLNTYYNENGTEIFTYENGYNGNFVGIKLSLDYIMLLTEIIDDLETRVFHKDHYFKTFCKGPDQVYFDNYFFMTREIFELL